MTQQRINQDRAPCPHRAIDREETLFFAQHRRAFALYATNRAGGRELTVYYNDLEVCFDDPKFFAFGQALIQQPSFVAGEATAWGSGYDWADIQPLLTTLVEEGVLQRADFVEPQPDKAVANTPMRPRLPRASCTVPRTWFDCEAITEELTGRRVELGYLELIIPVFRIAHIAVDADGRQVGEANVFPKALRLDVPTQWRRCRYAGSRYQDVLPMNITAFKTMSQYWPEMMTMLQAIRHSFLKRFPGARRRMTVGDLERLATLVLSLPTYLLMRQHQPVSNGEMHPVLSSIFRVTDGVRMTLHQMLFLPTENEPTRDPDAIVTCEDVYGYAERNNSFMSEHGVCAGPRIMIEQLLNVLINGDIDDDVGDVTLDPPLQAALSLVEPAFDYGLRALQAYAIVYSLWPAMTRLYAELGDVVAGASTPRNENSLSDGFAARIKHSAEALDKTLLGTESRRQSRERVYTNMYQCCAAGLGLTDTLAHRIRPTTTRSHVDAASTLELALAQKIPSGDVSCEQLAGRLMRYFQFEQAILQGACEIQGQINRLLGRAAPRRPFTVADINVVTRLTVGEENQLRMLSDELGDLLGLDIAVTANAITIGARSSTPMNTTNPADVGSAKSTCDGHGYRGRHHEG